MEGGAGAGEREGPGWREGPGLREREVTRVAERAAGGKNKGAGGREL